MGGKTPTLLTDIDYLTIASTGNAINFGDLTAARIQLAGTSNSVRGITGGGGAPSIVNIIEYFSIPTGGTAVDFGNLSVTRNQVVGGSNAHGGLNDGNQGVVDT